MGNCWPHRTRTSLFILRRRWCVSRLIISQKTSPLSRGKTLESRYESFYRAIAGLVRATGLSLMQVNMLVCWLGNILYLGGLMVLLRKLGLSWWLAAFGTLLAAQRFALMVQTPITHGLAIPREFWLWPLPWFLAWFTFGPREKSWLVLFYATIGFLYTATYPLWAVVFGLVFGCVDLWRIIEKKNWSAIFWLAGGATICLATVAFYNVGNFGQLGGGEDSALLERTRHTVALYFTKGFRRFLLFGAVGLWAYWELKKRTALNETLTRLKRVWIVAALVCLIYQPLEGPFRILSMLYLGRLSIFVFVISMVAVALCLHRCFHGFPVWKKSILVVALAACFVFPLLSLKRDAPDPQFVRLCWWMREHTDPRALAVVPPIDRGHFFRVYAERGMWIAPYDKAVLWHSRETYALQRERVAALKAFYDSDTPPLAREEILGRMRGDGVDFLLTRTRDTWANDLKCRVVFSEGSWQVRSISP